MNRLIVFINLAASLLALAMSTPAPAEVDPASLAEQDLAAESRGDVIAALALSNGFGRSRRLGDRPLAVT
jgi:hypothetical protein